MNHEKNVFITTDFEYDDFCYEKFENYELTQSLPEKDDFICFLFEKRIATKKVINRVSNVFTEYENHLDDFWDDKDYCFEERYQVPMMDCIRYYPSFVNFEKEDRYKCDEATTLLYNTERDQWGIGMTGGGMDLSPHLCDTFISLEKGVPLEIAQSINPEYSAYVDMERHIENCRVIAKALKEFGKHICNKGEDLLR